MDSEGRLQRYKARLVAKGFTQKKGIDYDETFSPVVHMESFRTLMAMAAKMDWEIEQMDVDTTFLNGDLEEEIYMKQPPEFHVKGAEQKVCRLKKAIYGLKQASRAWFLKFDKELKRLGFVETLTDGNVYLRRVGNRLVVILLYVDDIPIMGDSKDDIKKVKDQLGKVFRMKIWELQILPLPLG